MIQKIGIFALGAAIALSLVGCGTGLRTRQVVMTGGGAATGSVIAGQISDSPASYAAGALVGGATGLITEGIMFNREEEQYRKAYEQGRRDATVDHMNELWASRINPNDPMGNLESQIEPMGVYNGVGYFPRPSQPNPYELYDPAR